MGRPRQWTFPAGAWLALALTAAPAAGQQLDDGTFLFSADVPVPAAVLAQETCGADDGAYATRRPFAGGFVFTIKCPGNNENIMQTLIFARSEDGAGATLLRFPGPATRRGGFEDVIANLRWHPEAREVGEIAVDRDPDARPASNVCRSEGRWRLDGDPPVPVLVFWRETDDCDGKTGWTVIVGR